MHTNINVDMIPTKKNYDNESIKNLFEKIVSRA